MSRRDLQAIEARVAAVATDLASLATDLERLVRVQDRLSAQLAGVDALVATIEAIMRGVPPGRAPTPTDLPPRPGSALAEATRLVTTLASHAPRGAREGGEAPVPLPASGNEQARHRRTAALAHYAAPDRAPVMTVTGPSDLLAPGHRRVLVDALAPPTAPLLPWLDDPAALPLLDPTGRWIAHTAGFAGATQGGECLVEVAPLDDICTAILERQRRESGVGRAVQRAVLVGHPTRDRAVAWAEATGQALASGPGCRAFVEEILAREERISQGRGTALDACTRP